MYQLNSGYLYSRQRTDTVVLAPNVQNYTRTVGGALFSHTPTHLWAVPFVSLWGLCQHWSFTSKEQTTNYSVNSLLLLSDSIV